MPLLTFFVNSNIFDVAVLFPSAEGYWRVQKPCSGLGSIDIEVESLDAGFHGNPNRP